MHRRLAHQEGRGVNRSSDVACRDFLKTRGIAIVTKQDNVRAAKRLRSKRRANDHVVICSKDHVEIWVRLQYIHARCVATFDIPLTVDGYDHFKVFITFDPIQETANTLS